MTLTETYEELKKEIENLEDKIEKFAWEHKDEELFEIDEEEIKEQEINEAKLEQTKKCICLFIKDCKEELDFLEPTLNAIEGLSMTLKHPNVCSDLIRVVNKRVEELKNILEKKE